MKNQNQMSLKGHIQFHFWGFGVVSYFPQKTTIPGVFQQQKIKLLLHTFLCGGHKSGCRGLYLDCVTRFAYPFLIIKMVMPFVHTI